MSACSALLIALASPSMKVIVPDVKLADGLTVISPPITTPPAPATASSTLKTVDPLPIAVPSSILLPPAKSSAPALPPSVPIMLPAASSVMSSPLALPLISKVSAKLHC